MLQIKGRRKSTETNMSWSIACPQSMISSCWNLKMVCPSFHNNHRLVALCLLFHFNNVEDTRAKAYQTSYTINWHSFWMFQDVWGTLLLKQVYNAYYQWSNITVGSINHFQKKSGSVLASKIHPVGNPKIQNGKRFRSNNYSTPRSSKFLFWHQLFFWSS